MIHKLIFTIAYLVIAAVPIPFLWNAGKWGISQRNSIILLATAVIGALSFIWFMALMSGVIE